MDESQNRMANTPGDRQRLAADIKQWGQELGLQRVGISDIQLSAAEARHFDYLAKGYHG